MLYSVLYCIVLYCIVLYCIVLYCIVLYCIVLYCIVGLHRNVEPFTSDLRTFGTESSHLSEPYICQVT